MSMLFSLAKKR